MDSTTTQTQQFSSDEVKHLLTQISPDWSDIDELKINRTWKFTDFKAAFAFVQKVAELAEKTSHHPDIHIYYNQVNLELWTHEVQGLSQKDFDLATKLDTLA